MSSLAEVSNLLVEQNTVLGMQADATMNTNKNIKKLTDYFTGLDALEKGREASPAIEAPSAPGVDEGRPNTDMSRFSIGAMLSPAALLGIAKTFSKRLLGGGLLVVLADEIADAIGGEFQGELERAIVGLGIGSLFGVKFGIAAAAAAALLDKETLDEITPIIQDIGRALKDFANEYLPSWETIQNGIVTGLEGLRNIVTGDISKVWEEGQVTETLLLLGGLGLALAPGKVFGSLLAGGQLIGGLAKWTGGKVLSSLTALAGLGTAIDAAGAAAGMTRMQQMNALPDEVLQREGLKRDADGTVRDRRGRPISNDRLGRLTTRTTSSGLGRIAGKLGAIGAFLSGPIGAAILGMVTVGSLGAFAASEFFASKAGKELLKENEGLGKALENPDGPLPEELQGYQYSPSDMTGRGRAIADMQMSRPIRESMLASDVAAFKNRERAINNNIMNAPVTSTSSTVNNQTVSPQSGPTVNLGDQIRAMKQRAGGRP